MQSGRVLSGPVVRPGISAQDADEAESPSLEVVLYLGNPSQVSIRSSRLVNSTRPSSRYCLSNRQRILAGTFRMR